MAIPTLVAIWFLFGAVIASAWDANNPESVEDYIHYVASREHVSVAKVLAIARCESGIRANAVGDNGKSYGVFQIHLPSHPTISKEQALNPFFNISWAIGQMKAGRWSMWTCNRTLAYNHSAWRHENTI